MYSPALLEAGNDGANEAALKELESISTVHHKEPSYSRLFIPGRRPA